MHGENAARERLRVLEAARVIARVAQLAARAVDVARAHERLPEAVMQLPRALVVGGQRGGDVERARPQPGGLLVGELVDRALRRARRVADGARRAALARAAQEVIGDLREVRLDVLAVGQLERLGGGHVHAGALA